MSTKAKWSVLEANLEISSQILFYIDLRFVLFDLDKVEDIHVFKMIKRDRLTSPFNLQRRLFNRFNFVKSTKI